jgi:hypothetical protein
MALTLRKIKKRSFKDEMKAMHGREQQKHFPHFTFDFEVLPISKKWQDGDRYRIILEGEQVGSHSDQGAGDVVIAVDKIGGELIKRSKPKRFSRRKNDE